MSLVALHNSRADAASWLPQYVCPVFQALAGHAMYRDHYDDSPGIERIFIAIKARDEEAYQAAARQYAYAQAGYHVEDYADRPYFGFDAEEEEEEEEEEWANTHLPICRSCQGQLYRGECPFC